MIEKTGKYSKYRVHKSSHSLSIGLFLILVIIFIIALSIGRYHLSVSQLLMLFFAKTGAIEPPANLDETASIILLQIRLPRCIMAVLGGVGLSMAGVVFQALFRNPLVSPDILGVSSGCTFGAALGLILPFAFSGNAQIFAFVFGLFAVFLAFGLGRVVAPGSVLTLILAGIVITSLFSALLMCLKYLADPQRQLPAIVFWIMGSLSRVDWGDIIWVLPVVVIISILVMLHRFRFNVLSMGDIQSQSMGVNPLLYRFIYIGLGSLMVAVIVSVCGQIVWISLVIPHIARTIVGPNHIKMVPVSALLGAIFMLVSDTIARSVVSTELPISIVTALFGAPVFAFLLYKNRARGWI